MAQLVEDLKKEFGMPISDPRVAGQILAEYLTPERKLKIDRVLEHRTQTISCVLEGIYDRGNISAVIRSLEAYGFFRLHVIETQEKFKAANRVTQGSDKWMLISKYKETKPCYAELKDQGYKIYATHLDTDLEIDSLNFDQPTAIVFGNEKDGISEEAKKNADGLFRIPMLGFAQSFNISVAAAMTFYHIYQARKNKLGQNGDLTGEEKDWLRLRYYFQTLDSAEKILLNRGFK
jgi:tRNA (guanosine-2'-O-)-methyltransferase